MTDTNNNKETDALSCNTFKQVESFESYWNDFKDYYQLQDIGGEEMERFEKLKQLHNQEIKRISDIGTDFDNDVLFPKLKEKDKEISELQTELQKAKDKNKEYFETYGE